MSAEFYQASLGKPSAKHACPWHCVPPSLMAWDLPLQRTGRVGCSVEQGICSVIRAGGAVPDFDCPAPAGTGEHLLV